MNQPRLVIVDGIRTPFCKMGTQLAHMGAEELGRIAVNSLLSRTAIDPSIVDEVIMGCVGQPAEAANVARVIALRAGIPKHIPAFTVHRNCASGFEAVTQAFEKMCAGRGSVFIVGGTESMSRAPFLFKYETVEKLSALARAKSSIEKLKTFTRFRPSDFEPRIGLKLGLTDPVCGLNMGETAELLAREFSISREKQDAFAMESHARALAATDKLAWEICPVFLKDTKKLVITQDNGPRQDQTPEVLAKLKPVFDRNHGTVTAGNSSQITDGAVALLVMTETKATELGYSPLGAISGYAYAGCDPSRMGLGPVFAISKAEEITGLSPEQADLIEINEAFAAQVLAVLSALRSDEFAKTHLGKRHYVAKIPKDRLNVNGGSIALGHPVGATGARLILSSLKELSRRNAKRALVSLCVGGGQGAAIWLERI